ncbi:MAG: DUF4175 family protein [Ignavibacteria bacterium]|nr:DUF4175 family protein [Ignavibacteria bacterium]
MLKYILYALSAVILIVLAALAAESVFHFGTSARKIIYWGTLGGSVATVVYILMHFLFRILGISGGFDAVSYAQRIGNYFSGIGDNLSNSLSLYRQYSGGGSATLFSPELIDAELERVNEKAGEVDFGSAVDFRKLARPLKVFVSSLLLFLIAFVFFGNSLSKAANRLANYGYGFLDDLGISFTVLPGNKEIARGEDLEIKVFVNSLDKSFRPGYVKIVSSGGRGEDAVRLEAGSDGAFRNFYEDVQESFRYYAEYEGLKSEEFEISVADYPAVKSFRLTVNPPAFTGVPGKTQENEGDVFCPQGSELAFELTATKDLSEAGIDLKGARISFAVVGNSAKGSITANEPGEYSFYLKDSVGREGKNYRKYVIKVLADENPAIAIIEPRQANYELNLENEILIRARISDDYGFSGLTLNYRKAGSNQGSPASSQFASVKIPLMNLNATSVEVPYVWGISGMNIRRGEKVEYYLEVTDNAGKSTRSELRSLVYRAPEEAFRKKKEEARELRNELESAYDQAMDLQKEIEELKKQIQKNEELGLNEQKKQELEKKIDNFQKNLQSTQNQLQQNMEDLQESNMLDEKTLEQYMELQKMFNKINTPELQKMLEKLREALKKQDSEELREAMKNFKFDEEAFKKYMEKAMELLKKIENMQKFGELTQKLDEITKKQEELKKDTENSDKSNTEKMKDLAAEQMMIKDDTKEFNEELKKLIDEINKMKEQMSAEDLEKIREQMQKSGTENKMQESQNQLNSGQKQNSEKTQQEIMDELNKMNDAMKDAMSKMMDSQDRNEKLKQKLEEILKELKEMSERQQGLKEKTDDTEPGNKGEFQKNRQEQGDLQGDLSQTIDDLMNTTKMGMMLSPEMGKELGNAYNKMDKAGKELGEMQKDKASDSQGDAKRSLDIAAQMLGDMLSQMGQNGKKGKGNKPGEGNMGQLMQRLGEIIAQQMGLNGKTGKMGENGQQGNDGKGPSPENLPQEQKIEMDRLRLEQMQIQKSMEQLNEELKKEQERSGEKVFGDMSEVEKEMREVIKQLSEYNLDDKLKEKQNRILSRMLDARLSQREKDFEPKRESRPGENVSRNSPPEIVLSGPGSYNALREEFLQLQKEGYSAEYEALITKYLMELRKNGLTGQQ